MRQIKFVATKITGLFACQHPSPGGTLLGCGPRARQHVARGFKAHGSLGLIGSSRLEGGHSRAGHGVATSGCGPPLEGKLSVPGLRLDDLPNPHCVYPSRQPCILCMKKLWLGETRTPQCVRPDCGHCPASRSDRRLPLPSTLTTAPGSLTSHKRLCSELVFPTFPQAERPLFPSRRPFPHRVLKLHC